MLKTSIVMTGYGPTPRLVRFIRANSEQTRAMYLAARGLWEMRLAAEWRENMEWARREFAYAEHRGHCAYCQRDVTEHDSHGCRLPFEECDGDPICPLTPAPAFRSPVLE